MWYVHVHIPGEGQQGTAAAEGGTAAAEAGTAAAEGGTAASQEEDSWGPAVAREEDRSISLTPQTQLHAVYYRYCNNNRNATPTFLVS